MSFCNLNSKSDGRRYDYYFFFHLNTALPFPLQDLAQRLRSQTPSHSTQCWRRTLQLWTGVSADGSTSERVTVCKYGNFMLSQIKCARNCSKMCTARAARLFFTIRTIKFFLICCVVIRSIYTGIKTGQTSIRSISVPHSSFEFILDQKA